MNVSLPAEYLFVKVIKRRLEPASLSGPNAAVIHISVNASLRLHDSILTVPFLF
jgi:hypothetical protein